MKEAALKEKARDIASSTLAKLPDGEDLKRTGEKAGTAITGNPTVLVLGSLAAGLLTGLVAPLTRTERQKVGPVATQARRRAVASGTRTAVEQVTHNVDRGVDAVTQRVSEGIDTLTDQLKDAADKIGFGDVVHSVGERAKEGVAAVGHEVAARARDKANQIADEVTAKGEGKAAAEQPKAAEPEEPGQSAGTGDAGGADTPVAGPRAPAPRYLG